MEFHELLQSVVPIDHAAIEIVQIGRGKPSSIQRNKRTEFRRNDRNHIENHPLRFVAGFHECLDDFEPLRELHSLLLRRFALHLDAQFV